MTVDQPRHQHSAAGINDAGSSVFDRLIGYLMDGLAHDQNRAVAQKRTRFRIKHVDVAEEQRRRIGTGHGEKSKKLRGARREASADV
jgi:hypothetical protein